MRGRGLHSWVVSFAPDSFLEKPNTSLKEAAVLDRVRLQAGILFGFPPE